MALVRHFFKYIIIIQTIFLEKYIIISIIISYIILPILDIVYAFLKYIIKNSFFFVSLYIIITRTIIASLEANLILCLLILNNVIIRWINNKAQIYYV